MRLLFTVLFFFLPTHVSNVYGDDHYVLTQEMLNSANEPFVIKKDYSLMGERLVIPEGLSLVFLGGSLNEGVLTGTNTNFTVSGKKPVFGKDIVISGTWNVHEVHDGWFDFDSSKDFISNQIINNILALSNDDTPCHIFFEEERTYFFELPYKGRADIGNLVSVKKVDGAYKRNYGEIYNEDYSFLRIFTIPSNTHLTIFSTLKMLPTNQGAYFVFWEYGKENVTIDGTGTISGDNYGHVYDFPFAGKKYYGEWGFIIRCLKCRNFTIKDITLSDAFGDCLYYTGSYYPNDSSRWASDLTLDNVKIFRARRNGVAVGARHVRIFNCHFEGCGTVEVNGTAPRSAVDFEPDYVVDFPIIGNQDVVMDNCTFVNNYYDVASAVNNLPGYGKIATTIRNCHFTSRVKVSATYWMRFEKCFIPYMSKRNENKKYYSKHIEFVECDFVEDKSIIQGLFKKRTNKFTNCRFNVAKNAPRN